MCRILLIAIKTTTHHRWTYIILATSIRTDRSLCPEYICRHCGTRRLSSEWYDYRWHRREQHGTGESCFDRPDIVLDDQMRPQRMLIFWLGIFVAQASDEIYFCRLMMSCLVLVVYFLRFSVCSVLLLAQNNVCKCENVLSGLGTLRTGRLNAHNKADAWLGEAMSRPRTIRLTLYYKLQHSDGSINHITKLCFVVLLYRRNYVAKSTLRKLHID